MELNRRPRHKSMCAGVQLQQGSEPQNGGVKCTKNEESDHQLSLKQMVLNIRSLFSNKF